LATALLVELAELELLELDAEDEPEDFELLPHPTTVNPTTANATALTAKTDFFTDRLRSHLIKGSLHSRLAWDLVEGHGDFIGTLAASAAKITESSSIARLLTVCRRLGRHFAVTSCSNLGPRPSSDFLLMTA